MRFKGLEIRPPRKADPAEAYRDFICELIDEEVFILIDRKPTLEEERAWLAAKLKGISKGDQLFLTAWDGEVHAGNCEARRDLWKESGNVSIGLAVRKKYRGIGLGGKLLRETIRLAEKRFKPKNIYLRVFSDNKIAKSLYRKAGFRELAHFPAWTLHKGRYVGHDYMLLKGGGRR
jgi:RimJ/RimL family protein N-acetyltransferase